ncbi:MAG TPA: BON domain-containing protein [Stellaceae bacterium]|nr:BON domain-containing protein [Stellaceae bacterium]
MRRSFFYLALVSTLALSPGLGGCALAVIGGVAAAGGAGYGAGQERGLGGTIDDMSIKSQVSNALNNQYGDVTATVYGGRVLLTGSSPTPMAKSQAEQVASRVPGVAGVFNEIAVAPPEEPMEVAKDAWISARVRSDLVFDPDIRSPNYTIETERQSVYLLGSARSQAELDRAAQIARYVPGVQRVVSYVDIRYGVASDAPPGPYQAGMSPPPAPYLPPGQSGPMTPSAPSNAPIQVQKL